MTSRLEERIGHVFQNKELLGKALTHPSADGQNYQRLEFLGDRVLGLVIANWLLKEFPKADEGELAVRFNALVRKEACADIARRIDLGDFIIVGTGEEKAGGRRKEAILADACEAVIAALYLDGGMDVASRFIEREWVTLLGNSAQTGQDAKTALQEWTQGQALGVPRYVMIERSGPDHAPEFLVEVQVDKKTAMQARGSSKRQAEQSAARALLLALGIWHE